MINLLNELTEQDRDTIREYIYAYGGAYEFSFIGLDKWLYHWAGANKTLFKLLGNKLIYEFPIDYEKTRFQLTQEFRGIIYCYDSFVDIYDGFLHYLEDKELIANKGDRWELEDILSLDTLLKDKIDKTIKLSRPESKKILQLQAGMKPIKAISKILKYYEDLWVSFCGNFSKREGKKVDPVKDFEDFRIKHSMILNDKHTKGTMCISIHPMDFMTMSDNASDWSSCMSWKNEGCYRIGTVEMMNSNCVLCCYIKGKNDFTFNKGEGTWNNKRWRVLAYYNKDIIMSGKPYPFYNEVLCKTVIAEIKKLAETNLGRKFSFGPELYKDMVHVNSAGRMDQNRYWMENTELDTKNNILWDTNGMYNDMLNDADMSYWCYRNKVEHKKIYNASGKAPCLCCGKSVIEKSDWVEDYNDRFDNVDALLCNPCYKKYYCSFCHKTGKEVMEVTLNHYEENPTRKYCRECMPKAIKICPCCHRPMYMDHARASFEWDGTVESSIYQDCYDIFYMPETFIDAPRALLDGNTSMYDMYDIDRKEGYPINKPFVEIMYLCQDCVKTDKVKELFSKKIEFTSYLFKWERVVKGWVCPTPQLIEQWRYKNIVPVTFEMMQERFPDKKVY